MAQNITIDTSAYADGAILTEAKLDTTFGNVETAIENVLNGSQAFDSILLNATAEPVTISAGAVTVTRAYAAITSQSGTSDDLDTLTLTDGKFAFLRAAGGHTITLKHGTGNITSLTNSDVVLVGDDNDTVLVFSDGSQIGIIGDAGSGGGSIGGSTGATDNRLLRADGTGGSTVQSSAITVDDSGVMTGVSIDADGSGNVITNIGSSGVKAELITGLTADASPDGAADYVMTYDDDAAALKKVLLNNLPSSSGLFTSMAILRDEKTSGTDGGSSSATTWNNRNLNTETYDPDNIVSISSNQFTPISGTYRIWAKGASFGNVARTRLRLYNVTATSQVIIGHNARGGTSGAVEPVLVGTFTANGTDAYRIDQYTEAAIATTGLGGASSVGTEIYLQIELYKLT